jgi:WD40-like Beta Propeller Repeat
MGRTALLIVAIAAAAALAPGANAKPSFSPWETAVNAESLLGTSPELNTDSLDGCPIQSPDERSLYMASNRPGGLGGLDIWVAQRDSPDEPWGAPVNVGAPVNSPADDFCPTPIRGDGLYFVSRKVVPGVSCGMGDIYFARLNPEHGWSEPEHLGCGPDGPNSALDEQGPSYVKAGAASLYFSSGPDIFVSRRGAGGGFGPATPVEVLNTSSMDIQPNVRKDGRELVFASNRAGGLGGQDLWVATRATPAGDWSAPVNLGAAVNSGANETRPSLSWDGATLYFGRAPIGGAADVYVTTRERLP